MASVDYKRQRVNVHSLLTQDMSSDWTEFRQLLVDTKIMSQPPADLNEYICTHSGNFHCDEVLACVMLKLLPSYKDFAIVRTRDPAIIERATIVVDVGGTYNSEALRFDHHQSSFEGTLEPYDIKLSSAGLVFKHFGKDVIRNIIHLSSDKSINVTERELDTLFDRTYRTLIREVDAIDNGVEMFDGEAAYRITSHLSARIGRCNPAWNKPSTSEDEHLCFKKAMLLASTELIETTLGRVENWLPARGLVEKALSTASEVHPSGEILKLEQYCPWQSHLFDIEEEKKAENITEAKYVLYQDASGNWRVHAVPAERGSFRLRQGLAEKWRGKRDSELDTISGIPGCIFVHASGFIGGNKTYEGALQMAVQSLEINQSSKI